MLKWFISSQVETARRARGAVVMVLGLALFFGAFTWAALETLAGPDVGAAAGESVGRSVVTTGAGAGEPGSSAGEHGEPGEPGEHREPGAVSK